MKSNPFYALSASAMLLGCWLLSQALQLQAGQLRGLLLLMLVLQVYEVLLVGLGAYLVRSKRAPRDGLVVLVIESVFLMDATLLSAECVTTDPGVGSLVAMTTAALALLKLQWVRRAAPDLLPKNAAMLLGLHAVVILALPVAAAGSFRTSARKMWLQMACCSWPIRSESRRFGSRIRMAGGG